LGQARLRELRFGDVKLRVALAGAQVRELRLRGLQLLLRLLARRGLLVVLELEERGLGFHRLPALHQQPLQPPADRRGEVDVLALDVALEVGGLLPGAGAEEGREKRERGVAHEPSRGPIFGFLTNLTILSRWTKVQLPQRALVGT